MARAPRTPGVAPPLYGPFKPGHNNRGMAPTPRGAAPGGMVVQIDLTDAMRRLNIALNEYSVQVQRNALYNTLNRACAPLLTAVRRAVAYQTSIKYGRVLSHIRDDKAHPNRLSYRLIAKDVTTVLSEFGPTPKAGKQNVRLKVWNKSQTFKKAFAVSFGGKIQIVKRVAKHHGGIKGHTGKLGVKLLYGPAVPKEMIREGFPSRQTLERAIPDRVMQRLPHELEQAVARAKAKSGT